jgi:hypothetical protein
MESLGAELDHNNKYNIKLPGDILNLEKYEKALDLVQSLHGVYKDQNLEQAELLLNEDLKTYAKIEKFKFFEELDLLDDTECILTEEEMEQDANARWQTSKKHINNKESLSKVFALPKDITTSFNTCVNKNKKEIENALKLLKDKHSKLVDENLLLKYLSLLELD